MPDPPPHVIEHAPHFRRVRGVLFCLGAWLAFGLLQTTLARALDPEMSLRWWELFRLDLALALFWTAISIPIAAWHARVRAQSWGALALIGAHLPVVALVAVADAAALRFVLHYIGGMTLKNPFAVTLTYYADFDVVRYVAVVAVADALLTRRALAERERLAARLEGLLVRARLDYLEAQLQPHFLFNSLGAVSELAYEAPATAARVLRQLASIFRHALTSRSDEVTLGDELLAIEPYLDIQRIRFADWLRIDYDVDEGAVDCLVPRFVLQPLVENAIRHGLTQRLAAGCIEISARRWDACDGQDGQLVVRVSDNGVGLQASRGTSGYGIGLANVRERLAMLYGSGHPLRLFSNDGGGTVAELTLPVRRRSAPSAVSPHDDAVDAAPPQAAESIAPVPVSASTASTLPRRRIHPVVTSTTVWIVCGLLWTQQSYTYLGLRNLLGTRSWLAIARSDMTVALLWAALTPLVFLATSRVPLAPRLRSWRSLAYVVGGAGLPVLHVYLVQRISSPRTPFWSVNYQSTFLLDVVIVCVLLAVGHRRQLATWLRARESATASLAVEVREIRARATRLQSIPPVLLQSLERIATVAHTEPARTEHLLSRLGDYLRVAVESSDGRGVTAAREAALAATLAELERSGGFLVNRTVSA